MNLKNKIRGHIVADVFDIDNEELVQVVGKGLNVDTFVSTDIIGECEGVTWCDERAGELDLSCDVRLSLFVLLYCSCSVICCDIFLYLLYGVVVWKDAS